MAEDLKRYTDYLVRMGIDRIPHTNKTYLGHLIAVHRDLAAWGCPEDVCLGGMFHSIYGTEMFQGFKLPLEQRDELRSLIGQRAERLGYMNCAMDRASFDAAVQRGAPYVIRDRLTEEDVELSGEDFDDLCRIHLCDWLEQIERCGLWDYRRDGYRRIAERLGGVARQAYEEVYARGTAAAG